MRFRGAKGFHGVESSLLGLHEAFLPVISAQARATCNYSAFCDLDFSDSDHILYKKSFYRSDLAKHKRHFQAFNEVKSETISDES
jgi:hypothetical protein